MSTRTYISSASTKRKAIAFAYHNFKAKKQSFSASSVSANQIEEIFPLIKKKCPPIICE